VNGKLRMMIVLAALVALATACSGATGETSSSSATETDTTSPSVVISSGSQTVAIGGELPDGFPSEFPLPEDATVAYSASSGDQFLVWFGTDESLDDLKGFFDDELASNGWSIDSSFDFNDANGSYRAYSVTGNGYTGGVYVGEGAPGSGTFTGDYAFFVLLSPA
jgi:hypothetical protein